MRVRVESPRPLAEAIRRQLLGKGRRNYYVIITGKTQMRKSTVMIELCRGVSERFDLKKHMAIIRPSNMIEKLRGADLRRGDALGLDEFGVGMDHRRWQSFFNRALNYIMMTHGYRGIVVFVTVPYRDYIDADNLKLFDLQIEVVGKDEQRKFAIIEPKELHYNQQLKKTYFKYLRALDKRGNIYIADRIHVGFPPKEIMDDYYAIANTEKERLGKDLKEEAQSIEKSSEKFVLGDYAQRVVDDLGNFLHFYNGRHGVSLVAIQNAFGLAPNRARQIKHEVEHQYKEKIKEAATHADLQEAR